MRMGEAMPPRGAHRASAPFSARSPGASAAHGHHGPSLPLPLAHTHAGVGYAAVILTLSVVGKRCVPRAPPWLLRRLFPTGATTTCLVDEERHERLRSIGWCKVQVTHTHRWACRNTTCAPHVSQERGTSAGKERPVHACTGERAFPLRCPMHHSPFPSFVPA